MEYELYKDRQIVIADQNIKEKTYWLEKFSGDLVKSIFPYTNNRKNCGNEDHVDVATFEWSGDIFAALMERSRGSFYKIHLITMAGLILLLGKYTGNNDIIISTPIFKPDREGKFANTVLPIRIRVSASVTFREMLKQMGKTLMEASENQNYPIEVLLEQVGIPICEGEPSLTDTAILVKNIHDPNHIRPIHPGIIFSLLVERDSVKGEVEYRSSFYERNTIDGILTHFNRLMGRALYDLDSRVSDLDLLSEEERGRILSEINRSPIEDADRPGLGRTKRLHQLFENQVEKTPGRVAVGGEGNLTYEELNKKSNRLAQHLRRKGIITGSIVGLEVESSSETVVGIMAILKAGGACLPISPRYNEQLKRNILEANRPAVLLTQNDLEQHTEEISNFPGVGNPGDLAYIAYNAAALREPGGIPVKHRDIIDLVNRVDSVILYPYSGELNLCLLSSFVSAVSFTQVFGALLLGHRLNIAPENVRMDGPGLCRFYKTHKIDISDGTPAHLALISSCQSGPLDIKVKRFIIGEVKLQVKTVKGFFSRFEENAPEISYVYWPDRARGIHAAREISVENIARFDSIPSVKPLPGRRINILDPQGSLLPVGLEGELCISGETAARESAEGMYRTGDIGRWLPDGAIEILGRYDRRVIVKGNRIDLDKIEHMVLKYEPIDEAVVIVSDVEDSGNRLRVYFVSDRDLPGSELREYLSGELPAYLIPVSFIQLEKMPPGFDCSPDRDALRRGEVQVKDRAQDRLVSPGNSIEQKLVDIWSDIFEIDKDKIRVDVEFSRLNGQSLQSIMMASRIHKEFNISIPLPVIFELSTIMRIAEYIKEAAVSEYSFLEPVEEKEYYAVTPAQKRFYFLQQMRENVTYNVHQVVRLEGELDRERLDDVFNRLIKRHETFRTSFEMVKGIPVQRVHRRVEFKMEYWDLEGMNRENQERKIVCDFVKPFDLSRAPLLRVGIIKGGTSGCILMVDRHHIISDATSRRIFLKELVDLYGGRELPPLRLQYKDYSEWQNTDEQKDALRQQKDFWLKQFEGEIPVLELPTDYARPQTRSFEGAVESFSINREDTRKLRNIAEEKGATLYMVLLGVYNIFLSKISNREDIVVGTPVVGRRHADLENIMGVFINTLALRNFPSGRKRFPDFLDEIKEKTLKAFENQSYPFEELVEDAGVERNMSRNPLFDTMFGLQDTSAPREVLSDIGMEGIRLKPYDYEIRTSKFDLSLTAMEGPEELYFVFEYCTKLFKEETIPPWVFYFKNIIKSITRDPGKHISEIEIISEEEKNRLLYEFNNTSAEFPGAKTIHRLFEEQVEKTPGNTCVIDSSGHITYRELNEKSNRLAQWLRQKGVGPDTIVGIESERSMEMIIGVLGILKAGGAYLPIDPEFPSERIKYMLTDSSVNVLVTTPKLRLKLEAEIEENFLRPQGVPLQIIDVNVDLLSTVAGTQSTLTCRVRSTGQAYVIYTSGTTGKPVGVLLTHENVVNYVHWFTTAADLRENDKTVLTSSFAFDTGYVSLYTSILNGCELHVLPRDADLPGYIKEEKITYIKLTPSLFSTIVYSPAFGAETFNSLRLAVLGGEPIIVEDIEKALSICRNLRIMNHYGPTETTVACVAAVVDFEKFEEYRAHPVIGKPINNTGAYILDKDLNVLPIGVTGELCISGTCLAGGYLNLPELTSGKFVSPSPIDLFPSPLYKTGDLCRRLHDGNIEFLGRRDHRVKIGGFRVELDEIENQLAEYPGIKKAVVLPGNGEDNYLGAYFASDQDIPVPVLREYLLKYLPGYMIPSYFVWIEEIPLTSNGNIDRKALPVPESSESDQGESYSAPRNRIERKLVEIWSDILEIDKDKIRIDVEFSRLNGQSLQSIMMSSRIHKEFNISTPIPVIFELGTIMRIAEYIKEASITEYSPVEPVEEKEYYALAPAQKRFYFLQQMETNTVSYNVYQVDRLEGHLDRGKLEDVFKRLIERHDAFRTSFEVINSVPAQRVHRRVEFTMEYRELEGMEKESEESKIVNDFVRPFDLSRAPLLRVGIIKRDTFDHILMIDRHHIISDAVSRGIFLKELVALSQGKELTPLRLQYKDYSEWQNNDEQKEVFKKQKKFWLEQFEDKIPILELPTDYARPQIQSQEGAVVSFPISREETLKLRDIVESTGATLYMVLLGLYNIFLSKISNQEDIVVGTPVVGRRHMDLEYIIGVFVNTLALRNFPAGEKRSSDFLNEIKDRTLTAFENQVYPFEDLVEDAGIERNMSRNPLFDSMFSMQESAAQHGSISEADMEGIRLNPYDRDIRTSKFDMVWVCMDEGENDGLEIYINYRTQLFKEETIERYGSYFQKIVSEVTENNDIKIKDILVSSYLLKSQSYDDEMELGF